MGRQNSQASRASSTVSQEQQLSPELFPLEDPFANMTMQEEHLQYLSPPSYSYSSYLPSQDYFSTDFSFSGSQSIPQIFAEPHFQADFTHSLPPTLPSMTQADATKQDPFSIDDDFLNPFGISYATLAGTDFSQQMPVGYQSRSSLSSDSWSQSNSRENSPPYFTQPMTPVSRSTSPNIHFFDQAWQLWHRKLCKFTFLELEGHLNWAFMKRFRFWEEVSLCGIGWIDDITRRRKNRHTHETCLHARKSELAQALNICCKIPWISTGTDHRCYCFWLVAVMWKFEMIGPCPNNFEL